MTLRRPLRRAVTALTALVLLISTAPRSASGQERGAAALDQLLRGLPVSARVLMVGAHPDDEDTQLLAWLERGHQVHAAYLSLTRGDGGQNLIGNELGEALGAIRTEELLAARRLDGADQYFSRAFDFGFSKSADETFTHWDREALAGDVVRVIRAFRPHLIVAVFSGTPADGHGHHQASGILAREAFEAALDTVRFNRRSHGEPWQPLKFYRGAWSRNAPATMTVQVGDYDPVLGRSPAEIAGASRSQHRSQGFGALETRGRATARLTREITLVNAATPATEEQSIFDGIDTSFARLARAVPGARTALDSAAALIASINAMVDLRQPGKLVPSLAQLVGQLDFARQMNGDADYLASLPRLHDRAQQALLEAAGIALEATAGQELVAFADSIPTRINVYNRGGERLVVSEITSTGLPRRRFDPVTIPPDSAASFDRRVLGLVDHRPWWIGGRQKGMFLDTRSPADGVALISYGNLGSLVPSVAVAENARRLSDVRVTLTIAGVTTNVSAGPVTWRFADPVLGEQHRPVGGVPPVTVALDRVLEYLPANRQLDRRVRITLRSWTQRERMLTPRLLLPAGVRAEGMPDSVVLAPGETKEIFLTLKGTLPPRRYEFGIGFLSEGTVYSEGFRTIEYPHIRPQRLFRDSGMYLQSVPIVVPQSLMVAYVAGVSDASAQALTQVGVRVVTVTPAELPSLDLARFTTVVIGPRAYDAHPELRAFNGRLMEWVRAGGTMVVQYGQFEMAMPGMMPFPIAFTRPAARVTIEHAPVRIVDPRSKLLIWPNRITDADWAEWVQERAIYMPTEIDAQYRTPIAMNDPGEPENRGAILDATVGKGRYVYTSLSLFRQIPAGIPGGVRLLVNMLSAGITPE